jgi:hypothetical protein
MRPDVERARAVARAILSVTAVAPLVLLVLWVAAPGHMGGGFEPPWYEASLAWLGAAMYVVGLGWMTWIYRSRPETSRPSWRSRDRTPVPLPGWSSNGHTATSGDNRVAGVSGTMREDVARAQETARAMIAIVLLFGGLVFFLWIAAPGFSSGMFYEPTWHEIALPWVGWVLYLVGLGWMIRIYRSRPETSRADWRYRSEAG